MNKETLSYDILKEIFNLGVGQAANMLSEIINKKIALDVPNIDILDLEKQKPKIEQYFSALPTGSLMVSRIAFEEQITGEANLIFPADKMKRFINLCMHQDDESEAGMDFTDIDFDIFREIGNIILNSIIGGMGNFLDVSLNYTLPSVKIFQPADFKQSIEEQNSSYMLMLYVTFIIDDAEIDGAVLIDLTLNSLHKVKKLIRAMEEDLL